MRYNTSAAAIHGVVTGNPNMCPRMNPVAGCRMPAVVVNHQPGNDCLGLSVPASVREVHKVCRTEARTD